MKPMGESIARAANAPARVASCAQPATPLVSATVVDAPPGYEILREIGQGGMGVVYLARDCALDRLVALKCLQQCFASDPSAGSLFLDEARITGRLQHPGIPPVYQVGTLPDGRPFLAMKLILGKTLEQLLREQGPGEARWLGVFEAICQAVGYAHSQNVIHGDLKPANIMVGAFGEVQVMDWGLARVLTTPVATAQLADETDPEATRPPQPGQSPWTAVDQTRAGSALGTLEFISPEQAIGAIDRLDRRSDVFGLGAILCALLTGQPPFVAAGSDATWQLAAMGKLDHAFKRLDGCGAEPELIALARRCLSAEQDHRPADAGVLAGAVADLRRQAEERARQAELDRAGAVVQANEQRKRRRLLLAAAGVVIAVLLCGVTGLKKPNIVWRDFAPDFALKKTTPAAQ
jgi:serine/threonine protein kinase